jgi:hypothetical protein
VSAHSERADPFAALRRKDFGCWNGGKAMLSRRSVLAGAGAIAVAGALGPSVVRAATPVVPFPPIEPLSFRILRKGSHIGTHAISFAGTSTDALMANIDVDIAVRIAFIPVFRYNLHVAEKWAAGQFVSVDAKADYNGEPGFCTVRRDSGALNVEGSKVAPYAAPPDALAATHWNSAELRGPMINPENGMLLTPKIACEGRQTVALASGVSVPATKFTWRGRDTLDLWYQPDGAWTALTAQTGDGSTLIYERV